MKRSIVITVAGVLLVIGTYVIRYINTPIETSVARMTEYEESITGEAYFIRDERVYTAGAGGTFYSYAQEGSRVGKDRLIAAVYHGIVDEHILQELNNLDKKIQELEDYSKNVEFVSDMSNSQNRLKNLKNQIVEAAENNDPATVVKIKRNIKSITSGEEAAGIAAELENLNNQKRNIEGQLGGHSKADIYSDCSGVFSTNIDGLEDILTVDKINDYTTADFENAKNQEQEIVNKTAALSGEDVCKVIDNHTWYVMARLPKEKTEGYKKGQKVILRFEAVPGVEAEASLITISQEAEEQANSVLVFKCEKYIEGIFSIRKSNIEIIANQYKGYKIPISAVRVRDGEQGVMVQYGVNEIFKPCKIIYTAKEEDTVIIEAITEGVKNPLEQFDEIILGEKVQEGEK